MANKKISALTSSTTPLVGTEVLPIVQSGATVKTTINSVVDSRTISPLAAQLNGAGVSGSPISVNTNHGNFIGLGNASWASKGVLSTTYEADGDGTNMLVPSFGNNTARFRLNLGGDVINAIGNYVPGTAAKGINFTANTPAAGMTSQLLNWYEEGTWTPTIAPASGTITAVNQGSRYTRVGKLVVAYGYLNVSSVSTPSGAITISGLPFANGSQYAACSFTLFGGGLTSSVGGYVNASATTMVTVNFSAATMIAGANIMFTASYMVA